MSLPNRVEVPLHARRSGPTVCRTGVRPYPLTVRLLVAGRPVRSPSALLILLALTLVAFGGAIAAARHMTNLAVALLILLFIACQLGVIAGIKQRRNNR